MTVYTCSCGLMFEKLLELTFHVEDNFGEVGSIPGWYDLLQGFGKVEIEMNLPAHVRMAHDYR